MLAQYLLGELPEGEQDRLEEQIFTGEHYKRLLAIEEDLVEDYLHGNLSARDHERFESNYLASPTRRARVEFTKTLFEALDRTMVNKAVPARVTESTSWWSAILAALRLASPVWRFSLAAACLIVLTGGTWLVIENLRLRSQSQQLQAELAEARQQQQHQLAEQRAHNDQLKAELQSAQDELARSQPASFEAATSPSSILAFAFTINNSSRGARGSGERKRLVLPRDTRQLQLQLEFPTTESYRRFIASVQTPEGDLIALRRANFLAPGKVILTFNASLFRTNDYILTLKGSTAANQVEEIADYQFTVVKK